MSADDQEPVDVSGILDDPHARMFTAADFTVKATLTPRQAARIIARQEKTIETLRATIANRPPKRPRQEVETVGRRGFIPAAARFIRAAGKRAGEGDEFELAELVGLQAVLDEAIAAAVAGQRTYKKSWAAIGRAVGTTREAAWQRWGKA